MWPKRWDEISYSIYKMKLLLLSQRLEKKFITGRRDTLPCHIDKSNVRTSLLFCYQLFVGHSKKSDKTIPAIADMYNQSMGDVDSSDQMMYSYTYNRKSKSWSKEIVFNLLWRLLMNSYILYKLTVRNPKSRLEFLKDVIDSLASESKSFVGDPVQPPPSATKKLTRLPGWKERECFVCSNRKNNACRRSRTVSSSCQLGVQALCSQKHRCL